MSSEDGLDVLADVLIGGIDPSRAIEAQEARGQQALIGQGLLPAVNEFHEPMDDAPYEALGFEFGEPLYREPMFRPATLPEGWSMEPTDHVMWSKIVDAEGRARVRVFYKAAFYDRRTHMYLLGPHDDVTSVFDDDSVGSITCGCGWSSGEPVPYTEARDLYDAHREDKKGEGW